MKITLKEWMMLAIGVIIIGALIWGGMTDTVVEIYEKVDSELQNS